MFIIWEIIFQKYKTFAIITINPIILGKKKEEKLGKLSEALYCLRGNENHEFFQIKGKKTQLQFWNPFT